LIQLYHEGNQFPVKVSTELKPLAVAIGAAETWIQRNRRLLDVLNIPVEGPSLTVQADSASVPSGSRQEFDSNGNTGDSVVTDDVGQLVQPVTASASAMNGEDLGDTLNGAKLESLTRALRSADAIAADFTEIRYY
jgi:hypothetical protein